MPLFFNKIVVNEIHLTVWEIKETLEELLSFFKFEPQTLERASNISNNQKKIEYLVGKICIQEACRLNGISFVGIHKDEYGKPHLTGSDYELSISHTVDYVGVVLRKFKPLGIDIEKPQQKMFKILNRLFSTEEVQAVGERLEMASLYWSGKEALYKLYGKRQVDFKNNLRLKYKDNQMFGSIIMPSFTSEHFFFIEKINQYFIVIAY
jgi:4'-phosphopantetheinyl transferase